MVTAPQPSAAAQQARGPLVGGGFARQRRFRIELQTAADLAVGTAWFFAVLLIRRLFHIAIPLNGMTVLACALFLLDAVFARMILQRRQPEPLGTHRILAIFAVSAGVLYPPLFFYRRFGESVSRLTLLLFEIGAAVAVTACADWLGSRSGGFGQLAPRHVLIVGGGDTGRRLARHARTDRNITVHEVPLAGGVGCSGEAVDRLEQVERLVRTNPIDGIILVSSLAGADSGTAQLYEGIIALSERSRIRLDVCADWLRSWDRVHLDHLGGLPLLTFSFAPEEAWPLVLKRLMDVAVAGVGLLLAAPLLLVGAFAVLVESGRPVLFTQLRPGLRGRPFRIYKLRTMVVDAEKQLSGLEARNEVSGIAFKLADDPRITRVGRWLRKTSIDEIPQLWNVLRGEMSMVGPRPIPCELDRYDIDHMRRLAMKPGVTGLWQVSGRSSIRDFSRWLELDTEYIRGWSLSKDVAILARTVGTVLRLSGK